MWGWVANALESEVKQVPDLTQIPSVCMTLAFALVSELTGPEQVHLSEKCKLVGHEKRKLSDEKGNYLTAWIDTEKLNKVKHTHVILK